MANKKKDPISALNDADEKHKKSLEAYVKQVDRLYKSAVKDISQLATKVGAIPQTDQFSFSHNPGIEAEVDKTILKLASKIQAIIESGDREQWTAACAKSNAFLEAIMRTSAIPKPLLQSYQDRNLEALSAFQERKINGMGLSDRVWSHVAPLKQEVETIVDTTARYSQNGINATQNLQKIEQAIGTGMSADELSREIRSCLKEPNKLFRRVRDKYGNLRLSRNAQLYHPGQGVYRSSYKNAKRMTRSEINMAYRQSDYLRWQQLDFVVGIKIQLSGNHTCLGADGKPHPFYDICDELEGNYPKDFKFVGWHPQCKCIATPILKPYDEWNQDRANLNSEGYRQLPASNEVTETPEGFRRYIQENQTRIAGWKSTPYYIKDNPHYMANAIDPKKFPVNRLSLPPEVRKQLAEYRMYAYNHQGSEKFGNALDAALKAHMTGDLKAFDEAMKTMEFTKKTNERVQQYTRQKKELNAIASIQEGTMSFNTDLKQQRAEVRAFVEEKYGPSPRKIHMDEFDVDVEFTNKKVKEWLNQPHQDVGLKNEALKYIDKILNLSTYMGPAEDKHNALFTTHVFETVVNRKKTWILVREAPTGELSLHSITDSEKILTFIDGKNRALTAPSGTAIQRTAQSSALTAAKLGEKSELRKALEAELAKERQKLAKMTSKSAKNIDPAEQRHQFDEQIAMLKKNAQRYGVDVYAIDEAFASLDLKRLQKVLDEQQKILDEGMAKKKKIWDAADKRHAARTPEKEAALKDFIKEHKAKTESVYRQIDEATDSAKGINEADVSIVRDLKSGKAGHITTKAGKIVPTATLEKLQEEARKLENIVGEYNTAMSEAKALVSEFKGISGVDTETVLKQKSIKGVKAELKKLQDARKQIIDEAVSLKKDFDGVKDLDMKLVDKTIKSGKLSSIREISDKIREIRKAEEAISDLIPNVHELHKSYSLSELQQAHKELDGVLSKWLLKYRYTSIDSAPLDHLKNKLDFELSSPTFRYSDKTIIEKAIKGKIAIINQKILEKRVKRGGDTKTALNKEYKGGAVGTDISTSIDVRNMISEDPYGGTFTNNVARMQGFDAPAKLVTAAEFDTLEKNCGEVFYRTVNPTTFKGKQMTSEEFASQLYVADKLELNGPGGRVYGDGMYVAVSAWDGRSVRALTPSLKSHAYNASICYGNGNHTISEMTFTRKPKIIKQTELNSIWRNLSSDMKAKFGNNQNTYACALGYDAMYTTRDYMVIWNRSIIAVKKR